jgi:hypothetical protein
MDKHFIGKDGTLMTQLTETHPSFHQKQSKTYIKIMKGKVKIEDFLPHYYC